MKIAVLGASGRIGQRITLEALARIDTGTHGMCSNRGPPIPEK